MPLSTAVLLGEHTPLATVKRWKSVPSRASRSLFGVFTYGCPWQLISPAPVVGKNEDDIGARRRRVGG